MTVLEKIKNNAKKMKLSFFDKFNISLVSFAYAIQFSFVLSLIYITIYSILTGQSMTSNDFIFGLVSICLLSFIPILKFFLNTVKKERYIPNKNELEEYISSLNKLDKNMAVDLIVKRCIDNKNIINLKKLNEVDKKINNMNDDEKTNYLMFRDTMNSYLLKDEIKIKEPVR